MSSKYPPASRSAVLAFMLGRGVEKCSGTGGKRTHTNPYGFRYWDGGIVIRTKTFAKTFDPAAVWKALKELAAEGLVVQKLGGRHAGWYLTESGVRLARSEKRGTARAVALVGQKVDRNKS